MRRILQTSRDFAGSRACRRLLADAVLTSPCRPIPRWRRWPGRRPVRAAAAPAPRSGRPAQEVIDGRQPEPSRADRAQAVAGLRPVQQCASRRADAPRPTRPSAWPSVSRSAIGAGCNRLPNVGGARSVSPTPGTHDAGAGGQPRRACLANGDPVMPGEQRIRQGAIGFGVGSAGTDWPAGLEGQARRWPASANAWRVTSWRIDRRPPLPKRSVTRGRFGIGRRRSVQPRPQSRGLGPAAACSIPAALASRLNHEPQSAAACLATVWRQARAVRRSHAVGR